MYLNAISAANALGSDFLHAAKLGYGVGLEDCLLQKPGPLYSTVKLAFTEDTFTKDQIHKVFVTCANTPGQGLSGAENSLALTNLHHQFTSTDDSFRPPSGRSYVAHHACFRITPDTLYTDPLVTAQLIDLIAGCCTWEIVTGDGMVTDFGPLYYWLDGKFGLREVSTPLIFFPNHRYDICIRVSSNGVARAIVNNSGYGVKEVCIQLYFDGFHFVLPI